MVLPIQFMAGWGGIEQQRQKEMDRNNRRENASRISHDYKVGDKVLLKKTGKVGDKVLLKKQGSILENYKLLEQELTR
jgi:hypothetical protein